MNLRMGSQQFVNVDIPLLWGDRAVLQDKHGRLSVIDLSGTEARPEIITDEPAPGINFRPDAGGFIVLDGSRELYRYDRNRKALSSISLGQLLDVQLSGSSTRVGTNTFSNNMVVGFGVGIVVTPNGIGMGAPLPKQLAKLVI